MSDLLRKEMRLCASPLSYLFIAFGLMFFLPGYPVLCGAFFISLGMFQSYQKARADNDILFSALLPVAKSDVVRSKFLFAVIIELCGLAVMAVAVILRMTVLADAKAYVENALMNANLFALGMAAVIFGIFNLVFIGGFFKTAYDFGKPFVWFCIAAFLTIGIAEALHYFPGMSGLNAFGTDDLTLQLCLLCGGIVIGLALTLLSMKKACADFERIDL